MTKAAYLLFYRRRSDGPLGGPRFAQICEKFDNPTDNDDDAEQDMSDAGEGRRLGDGSSPLGSSRPGPAAGAIRPGIGRGSAGSAATVRGDDDELPSYDGSSSTNVSSDIMQISIEGDKSTGEASGFQPTQGWTFQSLDASHPPSLGLEGYASDDAQADSDVPDLPSQESETPFSEDRYAPSPSGGSELGDQQAPPPLDVNGQIDLADIQVKAWDRNADDGVIAVPPADIETASTDAAEIHLTDDDQKTSVPRVQE